MKKRIFYIIIILSIVTTTITGILSSLVYYRFYVKEAKEELKTIVKLSYIKQENLNNFNHINESIDNILSSVEYKIRITIIKNNGNVVYDNFANYETTDNHRNRPEIIQAFNTGHGENTRFSKTIESDTYYYAVKLNEDTVLRLSRELNNIRYMFTKIIPIIISMIFLIIFIAFIFASYITRKTLKPIKDMTDSLDDLVKKDELSFEIDVYEELKPFYNKIKEQKIRINQYINDIKYERDTIGILIENMKEGFILLNKDHIVLSINTSAKRMIGNEKFNLYEHKNILELTRNTKILDNIETAIEKNKHIVYDIEYNELYYRYYLSPVSKKKDDSVDGLMILVEDVTIEKNAEIMRQEFSANVSHELRTPLTTMIGFAEMIKQGLVTDMESIKKYCKMINDEGIRLITLIEDIIRLSKIEEGVDIHCKDIVYFNDVSKEVCNLLNSKAKDRNIKLLQSVDDITMSANKNYISELLYNLVDNGINYNKDGGKVEININRINNSINIVVRDNGLGIPDESQHRIFERFYRVDKSRSKRKGGTGLGLSIVKHIVELYKGTIELKSKEDVGTEINIKFNIN